MAGFVRKPRGSRDVTDSIDARRRGGAELVGDNISLLDLDSECLKPQVFCVTDDTDRGKHLIDFQHAGALFSGDRHFQRAAAGVHLADGRAGHDSDARLTEGALKFFGYVSVFDRNDSIHQFHQRHLAAHMVVEIGELHTYGAGAYYQQLFRETGLQESSLVVDDLFAVNGQWWNLTGRAPVARMMCLACTVCCLPTVLPSISTEAQHGCCSRERPWHARR